MWNNTPVVTFTLLFSNILDKIRHIRHYILIQGCIIDSRQLITHRIIFTINRMCVCSWDLGKNFFPTLLSTTKQQGFFFFFNEKIWKKNTIAKLRLSKHKEWRYNYIVINLYIFFICFPCWNGKKIMHVRAPKFSLPRVPETLMFWNICWHFFFIYYFNIFKIFRRISAW